MRTKWFILACVISSLIISSCGSLASKTVRVAVSLPLGQEYAVGMLNAAQLALKKADGKAGNVSVELLILNESDPKGEAVSPILEQKNVEQAIKDTSVVAYFGPANSSTARISMPILNEASMAQISASTTWPGLTKPGYGPGEPGVYYPTGRRTFFRTVPSDELQGAASARWAAQLGYKKAYIIHGTGPYEEGVAGIFEITAQDLGIQILGKDTYPIEGEITPEQIEAIVEHVLAANPDVVYLGGDTGANGEIPVRALREANATIPIMGPDGLVVDELIKNLGADLTNNMYGTTVAIPADKLNTPAAADFVSSYQAAYGKKPSAYDAASYEAMSALLYAISRAKQPTREDVLDAMQNLGDFSGIFGTWHFDGQGDISLAGISGMQVQNGAWIFVEALK